MCGRSSCTVAPGVLSRAVDRRYQGRASSASAGSGSRTARGDALRGACSDGARDAACSDTPLQVQPCQGHPQAVETKAKISVSHTVSRLELMDTTVDTKVGVKGVHIKEPEMTVIDGVRWRGPVAKYKQSFNTTPKQYTPILRRDKEGMLFQVMQWGLLPSWVKDPATFPLETMNARVERLADSRVFMSPLKKGKRGVLLVDGFYEWEQGKGAKVTQVKQPYFVHVPSDASSPSSASTATMTATGCDCRDMLEPQLVKEQHPAARYPLMAIACIYERWVPRSESEYGKRQGKRDSSSSKTAASASGKQAKLECFLDATDAAAPTTVPPTAVPHNDMDVKGDVKGELATSQTTADTKPQAQGFTTASAMHQTKQQQQQRLDGLVEPRYTYTILTTAAAKDLEWLHDRMPAVLRTPDEVNAWLDADNVPLDEAMKLLRPTPGLEWYPVSAHVGNIKHTDAECCKKISLDRDNKGLLNWLKGGSTSPLKPKSKSRGAGQAPTVPVAAPVVVLDLDSDSEPPQRQEQARNDVHEVSEVVVID
eukprot:m.195738 g.195738  ORF g.195738 m.195738 type:complete len:538 (+) comp14897_c0_seq1:94-1707(+)